MKLSIKYLALFLLFGCKDKPFIAQHDPRAKTIINRTWQLYANDLVDTSKGENKYVSRELVVPCIERIVFMNTDTLIQYDSCQNQPPATRTGGWSWYLPDGIFSAQIYTSIDDQLVKKMYRQSADSLQIEVYPGLAADSAHTKFYLRVRTYLIK